VRNPPTPVFPPEMGLHLFDYSVLLGDLVELVSDQAAAWKRATRH